MYNERMDKFNKVLNKKLDLINSMKDDETKFEIFVLIV